MAGYFEREIKQMIIKKIPTKTSCKKLNYYFEKTAGSKPNGIKTSQLPEYLGRFGDNCRKNFEMRCQNQKNAQAVNAYNNIIVNRHNAAHLGEISMTFTEVITAYKKGHVILDFISESLRKR
jgi:hypothetical protein